MKHSILHRLAIALLLMLFFTLPFVFLVAYWATSQPTPGMHILGTLLMTFPRMGFMVSVVGNPVTPVIVSVLCYGAAVVLLVIRSKRKRVRQCEMLNHAS